MAAIILLAESTAHRSATYVRDRLVAFGHTVTIVDDSTISSASAFDAYDLICSIRGDNTISTAVAGYIKAANIAGKPVLLGGSGHGLTNNVPNPNDLSVKMGIAADTIVINTLASIWSLGTSHPIMAGVTPNATITMQSGGSSGNWFMVSLKTPYIGTILAARHSGALTDAAIVAVDTGTSFLDSGTTGARIAHMSYLYSVSSSVTFSVAALGILDQAVDWLLEPPVTPDGPVLSGATGTATGDTTAAGTVITDTDNGILYYYASLNSTETDETVEAEGATAFVVSTGEQEVNFTDLLPGRTYYNHYFQTNTDSERSNVVSSAGYTTTGGLVIRNDFEGSNVDVAGSSITWAGNVPTIRLRAGKQASEVIVSGNKQRWLNIIAQIDGLDTLDVGVIPQFMFLDYAATATDGTYHGGSVAWPTTRKPKVSLDNGETYAPFDNSTRNTNHILFSNDTPFTQDSIRISRHSTVSVTQWGQFLDDMRIESGGLLQPGATALAFTPTTTATDFPAGADFIAEEYPSQTNLLGKVSPLIPFHVGKINDTSMMPAFGRPKGVLAITTGTHAAEDSGEKAAMGIIKAVLGNSAAALHIRRHCVIYIFGIINAPARWLGGWRGMFPLTVGGIGSKDDANRNWTAGGIDIVDRPKAVMVAEVGSGVIPNLISFNNHASFDNRRSLYVDPNASDPNDVMQGIFRTRWASISGHTIADEGDSATGFESEWWENVKGSVLAATLEWGDPAPVDDSEWDQDGQDIIDTTASLMQERLLPGWDPTLFEATGTLVGPGSTTSGTATRRSGLIASGVLQGHTATTAGTATRRGQKAAAGVLAGHQAVTVGSAHRRSRKAVSGVLQGHTATVVGSALRYTPTDDHNATGVLTGPGSTTAGVATHRRRYAATGVLQGHTATTAGSAQRRGRKVTAGVLTGPGSTTTGTATLRKRHTATGALGGHVATLAGVAFRRITRNATGDLVGPGSTVAGTARRRLQGTRGASGTLVGNGSTLFGSATRRSALATVAPISPFASIKRSARQAIHEAMGVQAYYKDKVNTTEKMIRARWHSKIDRFGDMGSAGYAELIQGIDRIILHDADARRLGVRRGGEIRFTGYDNITFYFDSQEVADGPYEEIWMVSRKEDE